MNIKLLSTLAISSLLLIACSSNDNPQNEESQTASSENTSQEEQSTNETENVEKNYRIDPETFSVVPLEGSDADPNVVLLTFDDAPYGNSINIAETLEEKNANAMFFVNGMYLDEEGSEVIEQVENMGNVIGNHTQTHANLQEHTEETQYQEIAQTSNELEELLGEAPKFFRAPHGAYTEYSLGVMDEFGMTNTNWSFGYDWMPEYQQPDALIDITLNSGLLGPGSNILMHDRDWTAAAVSDMIDGIRAQGLEIVDPNEIISDHELAEVESDEQPQSSNESEAI